MGKRENKVESYFKDRVAKIGGRSYKWTCPGEVGVMDQIAMVYGWTFYVEIKPGKRGLSAHQERKANELRNLGQRVYAAKDYTGVNRVVLDILAHVFAFGPAPRREHAIRE